ncbi:ferric reduction oxidase 8 [Pyrus ussuriensis x Pyrus communis]|uniref:Ferric reduction oxidase 8 n=1 Tax=Pyrus ussuriensis x Pyrus communis TaxID=2448454 RepID=A0A5N5G1J7_9ROSA|nr:ferric reduction oxidase 8 [Pyrus ussuriensis x Pyrus communis]
MISQSGQYRATVVERVREVIRPGPGCDSSRATVVERVREVIRPGPGCLNVAVDTFPPIALNASSVLVHPRLTVLTWNFYPRILNGFKNLKPSKSLALSSWQLKYLKVATRFSLLAEVCLAFLLFPIVRGLALFQVLGIQFEASIKYHAWLGTAMLFFATFHGASTLFIWGVSHYIQEDTWKWQNTGEICRVTGLVIWITSLPQIRRKQFEIFYLLVLFHAGDRHFYAIFPGIFLLGHDKLLRIMQSKPECILFVRIFPSNAIDFSQLWSETRNLRLKYTPTSVIFVKAPSISRYQWHSFSIISSSRVDENTISLSNMIQTRQETYSDRLKYIPIAVEGPYGLVSMDSSRYDSLMLVAGGIGITPFLSILQELASFENSQRTYISANNTTYYVVEKSQDICLLNSISTLIFNQPAEKCQQYGTTVRELPSKFSQVKTVQVGTKFLNYSISGLESSAWMAAIARISSILLLIFLTISNHIFMEKDTEIDSSYPPKTWEKLGKNCSIQASDAALEQHEIYFGRRPNFDVHIFAKFLDEAGGSDIGMMVCGRENMKE